MKSSCGQSLVDLEELSDMSVDDYTKLKLIGRGNYGEAWLVRYKRNRRKYVLKMVDLRFADEQERIGAEREAQLLSQLKHPNMVSYKESFNTPDGYLCIAMGFCEGGDLYRRLHQQNGVLLEEQQVGEWFVQIAMAIKYMHDKHILHRDLKTQNIFLTRSAIIKVGDLGIARVLENSNAMATTLIGTPYYMSPELFSNKPYDYKSDIWSLGCCVYEMMTLKNAFDAKNLNALAFRIVQGKLPPMPGRYSTGLLCLVKTMLQKNPRRRPTIDQILANPYVKKQIVAFLEKTKNNESINAANHLQQPEIDRSAYRPSSLSDELSTLGAKSNDHFSKAAPSDFQELHHSVAEDSKREKRRKKKNAQLLLQAEEYDKIRNAVSDKNTRKPIDENFKLHSSIDDNKTVSVSHAEKTLENGSKVIWEDKHDVGSSFVVDLKQVFDSVNLSEVHSNGEITTAGNAKQNKGTKDKSSDLKGKSRAHEKSLAETEVYEPMTSSADAVKRLDSPKLKSRQKVVKKLSTGSNTSTDFEVDSCNSVKEEKRVQSEVDENEMKFRKRKISKEDATTASSGDGHLADKARNGKTSISVGRPLPPRPGKSSVEPTESQCLHRGSISSTPVQSNSSSTSVSSSASSANSKEEVMDVHGNLNSSSRRRRRKQKETEWSCINKSLDAVVLSQDMTHDVNVWHVKEQSSTDDVDGIFHPRSHLKESRLQVNPLISGISPNNSPRNSYQHVTGKQTISIVDDLESSSSESTTEDFETLKEKDPSQKEIKNFILLLCSTLLLKDEEKTTDRDNESNDDEEENNMRKSLSNSASDTALFVRRRPLPQPLEHNGRSYNDVCQAGEMTGRLFERISALRIDCLRGLGPKKLDAALSVVENFETEDTEHNLIELLGLEDFANYAGKILQLKFCMASAFSPGLR